MVMAADNAAANIAKLLELLGRPQYSSVPSSFIREGSYTSLRRSTADAPRGLDSP
jgi:hypothetical protein